VLGFVSLLLLLILAPSSASNCAGGGTCNRLRSSIPQKKICRRESLLQSRSLQ
jgi:hypothetical protein